VEALLHGGVNRLSLGVQTFNQNFMNALGRNHDVSRALNAYELVRNAGFSSVNVDLLFGAPGQKLCDWQDDLKKAVDLEPDHISTYCLTFEEDTALFAKLSEGKIRIDADREAEFYEWGWEYLPSQGFKQYEVSNYARPGKECRHNLNTWRMNNWIGYGPSASSQYGGKRWKNFANIDQWAKPLLTGEEKGYEEFVELSPVELARDAILFGLRMNDGVSVELVASQFQVDHFLFENVVQFLELLVKEGLAEKRGQYYSLTQDGRIRCDAIAAEIPEPLVSAV
jgi:oxygen-independent coproporphyrinogen-3 oxidase